MNLLVDFGGRCCLGSQYKLDEERVSDEDDGSVTAKSNNSSSRDEACDDDLAKELSEINIDDSFQISSGEDNEDLNSIDDDRKITTKNNVIGHEEKKSNGKNRRRSCIYTKIYKPSEEEKSSMNRLGETMKLSFPMSSKVQYKSMFKQVFQPDEGELQPIIIVQNRTRCHAVQVEKFSTFDVMKAYYESSIEVEFILLSNTLIISSSLAAAKDSNAASSIPTKRNTLPKTTIVFRSPLKKLFSSTDRMELFQFLSDVSFIIDLDICSQINLQKTIDIVTTDEDDDSDHERREDEIMESDDEASTEDNRKAFSIIFGDTAYIIFSEDMDDHRMMLSALDIAVASSKFQQVESAQDPVIGLRHKTLRTTIYSAVCCNDIPMLEKIISRLEKHEIDVPDEQGYRASHYAAIKGNNVCLATLLDAGANPNALDASMKSPIYYAAERKNVRALEMLEANGGLLDEKEKELAHSHHCKTSASSTDATSTMTATLNQFNERGERLNEMKNKTANLESVAIEYKEMAQQMKKNAKSEKIFGIF